MNGQSRGEAMEQERKEALVQLRMKDAITEKEKENARLRELLGEVMLDWQKYKCTTSQTLAKIDSEMRGES